MLERIKMAETRVDHLMRRGGQLIGGNFGTAVSLGQRQTQVLFHFINGIYFIIDQ